MPLAERSASRWLTKKTPNGRLIWDAAAEEPATLLNEWANDPSRLANLPILSTVGNAAITRIAGVNKDLVVKDARPGVVRHDPMRLPYLRASVALQRGLEVIRPDLPEEFRRFRGLRVIYQAPTMYGLFVPNERNKDGPQAFSAMSMAQDNRIKGDITPDHLLLPDHYDVQMKVYRLALTAAGIDPSAVWLDGGGNVLRHVNIETETMTITRIDISAWPWSDQNADSAEYTDHLPKELTDLWVHNSAVVS